jgi:hypothetical protein
MHGQAFAYLVGGVGSAHARKAYPDIVRALFVTFAGTVHSIGLKIMNQRCYFGRCCGTDEYIHDAKVGIFMLQKC